MASVAIRFQNLIYVLINNLLKFAKFFLVPKMIIYVPAVFKNVSMILGKVYYASDLIFMMYYHRLVCPFRNLFNSCFHHHLINKYRVFIMVLLYLFYLISNLTRTSFILSFSISCLSRRILTKSRISFSSKSRTPWCS